MRPVIHSVKHQVQYPFSAIATGITENILLATAVNQTAADIAVEVQEGSIIKAVFVELWLQNTSSNGHAVVILEKVPVGGTGATASQMADLFNYVNKKNILFTHEGLTTNDGVGNPMRILGSWFKIPKGKQRFGLGDRLFLTIANPSANSLNRCGFTLYKELT